MHSLLHLLTTGTEAGAGTHSGALVVCFMISKRTSGEAQLVEEKLPGVPMVIGRWMLERL